MSFNPDLQPGVINSNEQTKNFSLLYSRRYEA